MSEKQKKGRKVGAKTLATKASLLSATAALMIEKGSIEFSLVEISERTGLSAALVQYHFGNKENMLMALLQRGTDRAQAELKMLKQANLPVQKKLKMHIIGLIRAYFEAPYVNRLLHALMQGSDPEKAAYISDIFIKPVAEFQADLLCQGEQEGLFRKVDHAHFYIMTVGAVEQLVARPSALYHAFSIDTLTKENTKAFSDMLYQTIMGGIMFK